MKGHICPYIRTKTDTSEIRARTQENRIFINVTVEVTGCYLRGKEATKNAIRFHGIVIKFYSSSTRYSLSVQILHAQ